MRDTSSRSSISRALYARVLFDALERARLGRRVDPQTRVA
jgi:hypothetical protein